MSESRRKRESRRAEESLQEPFQYALGNKSGNKFWGVTFVGGGYEFVATAAAAVTAALA